MSELSRMKLRLLRGDCRSTKKPGSFAGLSRWFVLNVWHDKGEFSIHRRKIHALKVGDEVLISGVVVTERGIVS